MNYLKTILFGIVEGVTEWLPISSTAHMKILNYFISLDVTPEFYEVFEVVIQVGATLPLLLIFINKVWPFSNGKDPLGKGVLKYIKKDKFFLWLKLFVSCLPAIIYELFLDDVVDIVNESNEMLVVGLSLLIVGIVFLVVEFLIKNKKPVITTTKEIGFTAALIIGLSQLAAGVFPGVSRSGATIISGLLLGLSRTCITEYTFELSIPVMFGASLMKIIKFGMAFSLQEIAIMVIGLVVTVVVSLFMIRFLLDYVKKHNFNLFGIYRIIMGGIVLLFLR